jgi:hypothetical protein
MNRLSRRRLFLVAVVVAAIVGGAAAGIVLARGGPASTLARGQAGVLATGKFRAITWGTVGRASIVRDANGTLRLHLSHGFSTQRSPELYVYFGRYVDGVRKGGTQISELRRAWGSQDYVLHGVTPTTLRETVEIICSKCGQTNGVAKLTPTRLALS